MKTLKRLALRALLSKEQRAVILNSVAYSEHKYRVHGDVDGAIRVGIIRKELEHVISVPEPKFTKTQVDRIVRAVLCDFADWLRKKEGKTCVAVGTVVEKEKCDKCEHRDECEVRKALFNDADDKGNGTEGEDAANAQESSEQGTDTAEKDNSEETVECECGNEVCAYRNTKACSRQYEKCPGYIRPTDMGDQPGAPEADSEEEHEGMVEMPKEGE